MRFKLLSLIILIGFTYPGFSQISQGGYPKNVISLKSSPAPVIEMPPFDYTKTIKSAVKTDNNKLKPFVFAHKFEVDFNPSNSGEWTRTTDGGYCWQLHIRSEGAKSINLLFDNFKLPAGSRLFVFNKKENYFLGAFTSENNKPSGKFAIAPVAGDEITIQYETPVKYDNKIPFEIKSVNHDFVGILSTGDRRPLGKIAGECNIDINCDYGDNWEEVKNSVCRLIVDGREVCSGVLINNTAKDQKPYVLSAAHCYDKWEYAETSVYVFNYESPFCAALDGDPRNSVSGAVMKAQFDSLDFALVELSLVPPPDYRPYYAGWDLEKEKLPDTTVTIHHPWGDIKKIAYDNDNPEISDFDKPYTKNGFLKILRWNGGVTEVGSSGAPLFNTNKRVIGTLTGGLADCDNPIQDYFERFALSWDYKTDTAKQLKHWLDPINSGVKNIDGELFYTGEDICGAFTNLNDEDKYTLVKIDNSDTSGYWGGTNRKGITEFTERFSIDGNEQLDGVSLGVGLAKSTNSSNPAVITIKVYNGSEFPETLIYSKKVNIEDLVEDAMNFIGFDEIIEPADTFFVGFELGKTEQQDSFAVYQSLRPANTDNFFFYKQDDNWKNFEEEKLGYNSMVNVFELVACNIDDVPSDTPIVNSPVDIAVYPNPANGIITLETGKDIEEENISVLDLMGREVKFEITVTDKRKALINLTGNVPGVYFIRFDTGNVFATKKLSFVPW